MREQDDNDGLSDPDHELEGMLRSLMPAAARIDPLAAAFDAGRNSQRRRVWAWRSAAALMLVVGVAGWLLPLRRHVSSPPPNFSAVIPISTRPVTPLPDHSLLMIQQAVRDGGVDALPEAQLPAIRLINARDLL
jgi:hypothetical protein